jgi:mono/diheme cytochrome c family protein
VGLSGCTDWAGYDLDYFWGNIPQLSTMRGSVTFDPYELPRLPADHTIPVSGPHADAPPPFTQAQLDSAAATLTNPYGANPSPRVIQRGKALYDTQCIVCHGPSGAGDGPVVGQGKFPFALPLISGTAPGRSDGYIYGIIVVGRGLMPPYGEKLTHLDRWAGVEYVRELERQAGVGAGVAPAAAPIAAPAAAPAGQP